MKNGKSLVELAQELERQSKAKQDFVASTEAMEMTNDGHLSLFHYDHEPRFSITDNAHSQISQRLNIPLRYYKRMRSLAPDLLATNVNTWFLQKPERRMIRTLDGKARAFLSDRYRRLDNFQLADFVLPVLQEWGDNLKIVSAELTEKRMYIKAINQRLELEVNSFAFPSYSPKLKPCSTFIFILLRAFGIFAPANSTENNLPGISAPRLSLMPKRILSNP